MFNPKWNQILRLTNIWLRDHCRCEDCYDDELNLKKFTILDLPDELSRKTCEISDKQIVIECESSFCF